MNQKTHYVYVLKDEHGHIRYAGQSINPTERLEQHIDESVYGRTRKCEWIRSMGKRGLFPTVEVVDETTEDKIDLLEGEWIAKLDCTYHEDGYLVNLTNGNNGSTRNREIDDVELRTAIQEHKKAAKKKPKKPDNTIWRPVSQEQLDEALRLYETDRQMFNLKLAANRELESEKRRAAETVA